MKMTSALLIASFLAPALSQASQLVTLTCVNFKNQVKEVQLKQDEYDFAKWGNNGLENEFVRILNIKRSDDFLLVDKKDGNIETAVYRCKLK